MDFARDQLDGLPLAPLLTHLEAAGVVDGSGRLEARFLVGGYSNLTYEIRTSNQRFVLRRPPLGDVAPAAHDMAREHLVLSALEHSDVPVPRPLHLCGDRSVIGAPFYLMEYVDGEVFRDRESVEVLSPAERRSLGCSLATTLARIHLVDRTAPGLASFGRPEGFTERQLDRWIRQIDAMTVRSRAAFESLGHRLRSAMPVPAPPALLHGDFRIDNVIATPGPDRDVEAVLDWEMAAVGDPRVDLGMLMLYWGGPGEAALTDVQAAMSAEGFPTRREMVALYEDVMETEVEALEFFTVLAHFKMAVIAEGIYNRHRAGDTAGSDFDRIDGVGPALLSAGIDLADGSDLPGLRR